MNSSLIRRLSLHRRSGEKETFQLEELWDSSSGITPENPQENSVVAASPTSAAASFAHASTVSTKTVAVNTDVSMITGDSVLRLADDAQILRSELLAKGKIILDLEKKCTALDLECSLIKGQLEGKIRSLDLLRETLLRDLNHAHQQQIQGWRPLEPQEGDFTYLDAFELLRAASTGDSRKDTERMIEAIRSAMDVERRRSRALFEERLLSYELQIATLEKQLAKSRLVEQRCARSIASATGELQRQHAQECAEMESNFNSSLQALRHEHAAQIKTKEEEIAKLSLNLKETLRRVAALRQRGQEERPLSLLQRDDRDAMLSDTIATQPSPQQNVTDETTRRTDDVAKMKVIVAQATQEKAALQEKVEEQQSTIMSNEAEITRLQDLVADFRQRLSITEERLRESESANFTLQKKNETVEQRLTSMTRPVAVKADVIHGDEMVLDDDDELAKVMQRRDQAVAELDLIQNSFVALQKSYAEVEGKYTDAKREGELTKLNCHNTLSAACRLLSDVAVNDLGVSLRALAALHGDRRDVARSLCCGLAAIFALLSFLSNSAIPADVFRRACDAVKAACKLDFHVFEQSTPNQDLPIQSRLNEVVIKLRNEIEFDASLFYSPSSRVEHHHPGKKDSSRAIQKDQSARQVIGDGPQTLTKHLNRNAQTQTELDHTKPPPNLKFSSNSTSPVQAQNLTPSDLNPLLSTSATSTASAQPAILESRLSTRMVKSTQTQSEDSPHCCRSEMNSWKNPTLRENLQHFFTGFKRTSEQLVRDLQDLIVETPTENSANILGRWTGTSVTAATPPVIEPAPFRETSLRHSADGAPQNGAKENGVVGLFLFFEKVSRDLDHFAEYLHQTFDSFERSLASGKKKKSEVFELESRNLASELRMLIEEESRQLTSECKVNPEPSTRHTTRALRQKVLHLGIGWLDGLHDSLTAVNPAALTPQVHQMQLKELSLGRRVSMKEQRELAVIAPDLSVAAGLLAVDQQNANETYKELKDFHPKISPPKASPMRRSTSPESVQHQEVFEGKPCSQPLRSGTGLTISLRTKKARRQKAR